MSDVSLSQPASAGADRSVVRTRPAWPWAILAMAPLLAAVASTFRLAINGDVTYVLGSIRAAGLGGVGLSDVFVVRPYLYRLVISGFDHGRQLVTPNQTSWLAETVVRLQANVLVALVALLLFAALRRRVSTRSFAGPVALAVGGALMLAPNWSFLQPDWVATVVSVLAVGAALYPRRAWLGVVLGSLAVWSAVAVKTPTAAWAAIALIAIAAIAWRRAVGVAVGSVLVTGVWYLLTKHFQPWELTWLKDQAAMAQNSPLHHGLRWEDLGKIVQLTANVAVLNPVMMLAPAAAGLIIKRASGHRVLATLALVCVAGLSVASPYAQGQWFMYHFVGMPVVAAALWGVALGRRSAARVPLLIAPLVAVGYTVAVMSRPYAWRKDHLTEAALGAVLIAAVALVVALRMDRDAPAEQEQEANAWMFVVGLIAAVLLVVPSLPRAPYAFDAYDANLSIGSRQTSIGEQYQAIRDEIGADTRVTYLAFGSVIYGLGNPTTCRYPSPLFLQRATVWPDVTGSRSYADNLKCLDNDGGAKYLVLQPSWFHVKRAAPAVRQYVAQFDCSPAVRVPDAPAGLLICPRRT